MRFCLVSCIVLSIIVLSCKGTESLKNPQTFMLKCREWVMDVGC